MSDCGVCIGGDVDGYCDFFGLFGFKCGGSLKVRP